MSVLARLRWRLRAAMLGLLGLAGLAAPGHAGATEPPGASHIAFVVGIGRYEFAPDLPNAAQDAAAVAQAFRNLGYRTWLARDITRRDMLIHLARLRLEARDAVQVVIYFAGHGVVVGGESYLLLRDTAMDGDVLAGGALPLRVVTRALSDRPRQKILLLDSCRNTPAPPRAGTAAPRRHRPPAGLFLGYAAQPGQIAYDGSAGRSPFATALIEQLARPPQSLDDLLRAVRLRVIQLTSGQQIPWSQSSLLQRAVLSPQRSSGPWPPRPGADAPAE